MYIHNLANIVNKYNNTYHNTVNKKPAGGKSRIYIEFNKENNKNNNLKLVIMLQYQNIKTFCKKVTLQIGLKKLLKLKKLKILYR